MSFRFEISGDYACFTRPELKVERVSYDVITPSAARGILEAVFWKPAIRYIIDKIEVCNPIKFDNILRNEVSDKASVNKEYLAATSMRVQRNTMLLRDVKYVITAHFEQTDELGERDKNPDGSFNHGKFADSITRALQQGRNYYQPYLGVREFPANVRLVEKDEEICTIDETRDLGLMLYDIEYIKADMMKFVPTYFKAFIDNGVIDLKNVEVLK
ncbi:MAG: type I-C CRISPR-associated protein Cas5c [Clostridiales bacterium]|jgi:CRISPR-associated protein Cas5d|nr:type I-C CRISPR-associated protein Cas5c [Clostridiales bacterium]